MIKNFIFFLLTGILVPFLAANIYFSQNHNNLLFNLLDQQDGPSAVMFLTKIKKHKDFETQLKYFRDIYGDELVKEVFQNDLKRKQEIVKFESLLAKNPASRDLLLTLSVLYYLDDNKLKAKDYYIRARSIDPRIKVEELERIN